MQQANETQKLALAESRRPPFNTNKAILWVSISRNKLERPKETEKETRKLIAIPDRSQTIESVRVCSKEIREVADSRRYILAEDTAEGRARFYLCPREHRGRQ